MPVKNNFSQDFFSIARIAELLKLPKLSSARNFQRIFTDSRNLKAGDFFVAIAGENFDGHDFVWDAQKKGAVAALISRKDFKNADQIPKDFPLLLVEDSIQALRSIAKAYRQTLRLPIFAVAGSNGKTTTKEWIAFLYAKLNPAKKVFKTEKSQNSILGIALSLLQIRDEDLAVLEIGIDEPGWMDQHLEVVKPTHGLITTIAEEHLNRLKTIEIVAEEELKLLSYLQQNGGQFTANLDSAFIAAKTLPEIAVTYALDTSAQIEGKFLSPHQLHVFGVRFDNPLPGKHNAQNLLAAIAALRTLNPELKKEDLENLTNDLASFKGEKHRSVLIHTRKGNLIFDDCYNANPDSMEKSMQAFLDFSNGFHRVGVLGDMLDLGDGATEAHRRLLNRASVLPFDSLFLFGPHFSKAYEEMPIKPEVSVARSLTIEELKEQLQAWKQSGSAFMVKGSRSMGLERVLPTLEAL